MLKKQTKQNKTSGSTEGGMEWMVKTQEKIMQTDKPQVPH